MKIGIVAGEVSGDLLGSQLINALKQEYPQLEFVGIAGPKMQAAGATTWYPMEKLAVRGYIEVLKHFREILAIRRGLRERLLRERPVAFIGIDAPDFNLGLEKALKQAGIPTIHYVSPSLWAWRGERIHKIKAAVDHMLTIFPFEPAIYQKVGVTASYVGHPLADSIPMTSQRESARVQLRLRESDLIIALLPGSRQSELEYHADLYVETAREILKTHPEARFLVPLATRETRDHFNATLWRYNAQDLPIQVLFGHANLALAAADVGLVASGTATLEAALLRCPHVITYRISPITYWMVKDKGYLPYVGLPNILAGDWLVPELLQHDATPQNLARALTNWVRHRDSAEALRARFDDIHQTLAVDNAQKIREALGPLLRSLQGHTASDAVRPVG
ncbi:MAG: lipid-A-disaccharide synthase [Betaproteobacteria bacterium]|nr:lipid-A-disaccharide synthase [Betaproteobacteria bacterium]